MAFDLAVHAASVATALPLRESPWQNGADECFNGKLREEQLTLPWYRNRLQAKVAIETWCRQYNEVRPIQFGQSHPVGVQRHDLCRALGGGAA